MQQLWIPSPPAYGAAGNPVLERERRIERLRLTAKSMSDISIIRFGDAQMINAPAANSNEKNPFRPCFTGKREY
jgi:hypothetical protein